MSASITETSGGGLENVAIDDTPAVTDIVDTIDTTTVSLDATGEITEAGGTVTYTATVDNAPAEDMTVTLDNGETITISAGETSGSVDVEVAADEDAIADATDISATITETSGGGFENVAIDDTPAVTDIVDTIDTTTVSLDATGEITEAGGTVTYTATVDNAPAEDMTVTLDNGETITISAGETTGTVDVEVAADEDAIADATDMSASITETSGGGFEDVAIDDTPAVTDIVDTIDTTTVSLDATGEITEAGGTVTYTATVDNAPAEDMTVTLDNGETITISAGETSGSVDVEVAADEDAIADATDISATITETSGGGFENVAIDDTPAVTDIVDTIDTTTVSLDATGEITEAGGTVTYTATVDNAPAEDMTVTLDNGETITISAGETTGTVDVEVAADEDAIADATDMSASITETSGGGFEDVAIDDTPAVTDIVDTIDTTTVSLDATGEITEAGGTVTYTATVDNAPAEDMTVTLDNGETITISAGETTGTVDVEVAADEDAIADATDISATITETSGGGFEDVAIDDTPAVTDIVDTIDTTTVSLDATGEITEAGGTVTYTATVDNAPAEDMTVTLDNGETITISAGETTGTVDVEVVADEDAIVDATDMSATITETSGGGFEDIAIDDTPAVTDIVDTIDTTTVSLDATGEITEAGGTVTYTATVDNAPAEDMTVTLDNGETITISAGETSGSVDVEVAADEDAIADATDISATITETSGGGFENVAIDDTPAVTDIVDTIDTTTVSLDATGEITEAGGTVTYTATVDNAPAEDMTVTLDNGETITISAGETTGTVDVEVAVDEDAIADATDMSASITETSGGGFEDVAIDDTPAVTDIVDTIDTTTVSLDATGEITEAGGTVTYTATVDNAPAEDMTVTLDNGETITISAGETSGSVDVEVAADEDAIADATDMSATITETSGGGFEDIAIDDTPAVTDIVDTIDTTTVSLDATGEITEAGGTVTYTATVDNAPAEDMTVTLDNGETITISAGETTGTVDVEVVADEDAIVDATDMSATITETSGGGFEDIAIDDTPAVTDIVDTIDTTTVSLDATGEITEAGGTVTYTATVDNAPAEDMTVTLDNGETITISAGETSGSVDVEVAADEDAIADATDISATITETSGGGFENVAIDDTPAVTDIVDTIDTTTVSLDATGEITEAGGTVTYTATVDNAPAEDMTVTLDNGETITISAGETTGTVDVEVAVDEDAIADATDMSASITETSGGGFEDVAIDDTPAVTDIVDTIDTTTVSLDATGEITEAGGTVTYTATVDNAPAEDMTVTLDNGETITISAGETTGTVDVEVVADEDAIVDATDMSATITETSGGGFEDIAIDDTPAVTDIVDTIDTTTVSLDATGEITEAGGTVTYTATVDNAPAEDMTVTLDNGETITISAGETSGTVDVEVDEDSIDDEEELSASITETSGGNFEDVAIDDTPAVTDIIDDDDDGKGDDKGDDKGHGNDEDGEDEDNPGAGGKGKGDDDSDNVGKGDDDAKGKDDDSAGKDDDAAGKDDDDKGKDDESAGKDDDAKEHDDKGHGNDEDGEDEDNPGAGGKGKGDDDAAGKDDDAKEHDDKGHGNDEDGIDEDNPANNSKATVGENEESIDSNEETITDDEFVEQQENIEAEPQIRLDEPPEYGTIQIRGEDDEWSDMEVGQEYSADSEVQFVPDSEEIALGTRDTQIGTFDGKASTDDWGDVSGKSAEFTDGDLTVTTTSSSGNLKAYNKADHHVGRGIGDNDGSGLSRGESLEVAFSGEDSGINQISFTLDGLGGYFDETSKNATEVVIKAFDGDGNLIGEEGGYRDSGEFSDTYSFTVDQPVDHFELSTVGGRGNFVVQNMIVSRTLTDDVTFTTIQSDGSEDSLTTTLNLGSSNANDVISMGEEIPEVIDIVEGVGGETAIDENSTVGADESAEGAGEEAIADSESELIGKEESDDAGKGDDNDAKGKDDDSAGKYDDAKGKDDDGKGKDEDDDGKGGDDKAGKDKGEEDSDKGDDKDHDDKGHGNDEDGEDDDNPAGSKGNDSESDEDLSDSESSSGEEGEFDSFFTFDDGNSFEGSNGNSWLDDGEGSEDFMNVNGNGQQLA